MICGSSLRNAASPMPALRKRPALCDPAAKDNAAVMARMSRKGKRYFQRTVLLGSNTDMSELTPEEMKRRPVGPGAGEAAVALIDREKTLKRFLAKHAPRLLGSEPSR